MNSQKVNRILLVIANPENPQDKRGSLTNDLAAVFCESCKISNIEIDYLDLYKENFNPVHYPYHRDTQTIEYQIRLKKVDMIVFFHPVWWNSIPAILKGFIDKVFTLGYAYQKQNGAYKGLLNKPALVICLGKASRWETKYLFNNTLEVFWKRAVFEAIGLKGEIEYFGNYRKASEQTINKWHKKTRQIAEQINDRSSLLDLV